MEAAGGLTMNLKSCSLLGWVLLLLLGVGVLLRGGHGVAASPEEAKSMREMQELMRIESVVGRGSSEEMSSCEEPYGFMPCSTKLGGNAALLIMYSYAFLKAAQLLTEGSELLLTVMSPGIIGGLVLPILGAFPDALLIAGKHALIYLLFFFPSKFWNFEHCPTSKSGYNN